MTKLEKKEAAKGVIALARFPLVYANMPKCACSTIKNILYYLEYGQYFDDPLNIHKQVRTGKALINNTNPEALHKCISNRAVSFTFVRHPLKRIYSAFNEKVFHVSPYSFPLLRNGYLTHKYGADFSPESQNVDVHRDNFKKFLRFVRDNANNKTDFRKDPHWLPQSYVLQNYSNFLYIDQIGKIETFESSLSHILAIAGVADKDIQELVNKKFNEGPPAPFSYNAIVDDEIKALGYDIYHADFVKLGYGS